MISGKIFLIIFVVISSVIGLTTIADYSPDENHSINVDDFYSEVNKIKIEISDGIGSLARG